MLLEGITGGFIALLLTRLFTPLFCFIGLRLRIMDSPGGRKWHGIPVPCVGGLIIIFSIIFPLLLFVDLTPAIAGLIVGGGIIVGLGIMDDTRGVPYYFKFVVQFIAVVLFLVISGQHAKPVAIVGFTLDLGYLFFPLVIVWMMGVINAINLIDGLDSLAGGVSFIILAVFSLLLYLGGHTGGFLVSIIMAGATLGFLRSNLPPAKVFLGDTGSLFVGFIVGSLSVIYGVGNGDAHLFTQPVLVLALPVLDVLYVMAFRISRNRNPFLGDRNHIHHVLLRRGIPGIHVVLIIYIMTLSFCILASLSTTLPNGLTILLFFSLLFLTILLPRLQPALRPSVIGRTFPLINIRFARFILRSLRLPSEQ